MMVFTEQYLPLEFWMRYIMHEDSAALHPLVLPGFLSRKLHHYLKSILPTDEGLFSWHCVLVEDRAKPLHHVY
jgi:hypothetical protein